MCLLCQNPRWIYIVLITTYRKQRQVDVRVWAQPRLNSTFRYCQGYIERLCLPATTKTRQNKSLAVNKDFRMLASMKWGVILQQIILFGDSSYLKNNIGLCLIQFFKLYVSFTIYPYFQNILTIFSISTGINSSRLGGRNQSSDFEEN